MLAPPDAVSLQSIRAPSGTVTIQGRVTVESIEAQSLEFGEGSLKATVLKASESISLSGEKLEVHVVVAPKVDIASSVKGRATAIQCDNELGQHKLKGGFSLAEFVSLVPEGRAILGRHGIPVPVGSGDEESDDSDEEPASSVAPRAAKEAEPAAKPAARAAAPAAKKVSDEVRNQVGDALGKIREAYGEAEIPPPVKLLETMVEDGDWKGIKVQINSIWSDLLKYHQQTGLYISKNVTHMFQTIQLLMRKVEA